MKQEILRYLITRCGNKLNVTEANFPKAVSEKTGINERTIQNILVKNKGETKINAKTTMHLVSFFKKAIPQIEAFWLSVDTVSELQTLLEETRKIELPPGCGSFTNAKALSLARMEISGCFMLYRYAFENTGILVKEIIYGRKAQS